MLNDALRTAEGARTFEDGNKKARAVLAVLEAHPHFDSYNILDVMMVGVHIAALSSVNIRNLANKLNKQQGKGEVSIEESRDPLLRLVANVHKIYADLPNKENQNET